MGGGILCDSVGAKWLVIHGGNTCLAYTAEQDSKETWILGPLSPASCAASWRWHRVDSADSFHEGYTLTVLNQTSLVLLGGMTCRDHRRGFVHSCNMRFPNQLSSVGLNFAEVQDRVAIQWEELDAQPASFRDGPEERHCHSAAEWQGKVILAGGFEEEEMAFRCLSDAWVLDPQCCQGLFEHEDGSGRICCTQPWLKLPDMPYSRAFAALAVKGDTLLVCGGIDFTGRSMIGLNDVWSLDLANP